MHVHEATISRRLKRLTSDLRKQLLRSLEAAGLSKRAAEEALGADPRDLEVNLRALLQTSQPQPFSHKESIKTSLPDEHAANSTEQTAAK
jgi:RNA polymerase sigma-70 factor (ECF subfamily)